MRLGIIGQGAASLFFSLVIKRELKNDIDITLIDKNEKIFKKLYATGNGRCNLANLIVDKHSYNNDFAYDLIKKNDANSLIKFLNSIGVLTRNIDNLVYPYSLSSKSLIDHLINYLKKENVHFINNLKVLDYKFNKNDKKYQLITNIGQEYLFDYLIIDCGGLSSPNLGSDGNFIETLKKHGYEINNLKPGLTPIKVKENIKSIENERVKVEASLMNNDTLLYKECGEVIFKKDALSGIVMMNFSSIIARSSLNEFFIKLDLFKDYESEEVYQMFNKDNKENFPFLYGYFTKRLADYIYKEANIFNKNKKLSLFELKLLVSTVKNLTFTFKELYPFSNSQVTIGGVNLNDINKKNFSSKKESNVYLLGEVLDLDGLCGGYNIMLCYSEAKECAQSFKDKIDNKQ